MKKQLPTFLKATPVLVCFLIGLNTSEAVALPPMESLKKTVEARELAFADTFAKRDLEAFLVFVSEEAVFFAQNAPLRGREAVGKAWGPMTFLGGGERLFSWHPDVIEVLDSGQLAISSGPILGPDGKELGRFNSIWRKEADGQWRVVFDKGS